MGYALELNCPNCNTLGKCKDVKTFADHSSYEFREFFEEITKKESNFRLRQRLCEHCSREFKTVEVDEAFLSSIKAKLDLQNTTIKGVDSQLTIALHLLKSGEENLLPDGKFNERKKVERYSKFASKLFNNNIWKLVPKESDLNEYFLNNDPKPFLSLVDEVLKYLSLEQKAFVMMRFGLGVYDTEHKRREIGKSMHSKGRIRKSSSSKLKNEKEIQEIQDKAFEELWNLEQTSELCEYLRNLNLTR